MIDEQDYRNFIIRKELCRVIARYEPAIWEEISDTLESGRYISERERELMRKLLDALDEVYYLSDCVYAEITSRLKEIKP